MSRHVFHMPVREMLSRIDSYELSEWFVFFSMEEKERAKEDKKREAESKSANSGNNRINPAIPPTF